jgi:hypothetical protein
VTPKPVTFPPERLHFACARCGARQSASVRTIFDTREANARESLLEGTAHQLACAQCGSVNRVPTPILYHDAASQSAFVLTPGLGSPRDDEERAIGRLTNRVIESLPLEDRRMYLLTPKSFLTESSFYEAVLGTTGVTPEMIEAARARSALIERLVREPDAAAREAILTESGEDPRRLAAIANAMAEQAQAAGESKRAEALIGLASALGAGADDAPTLEQLIGVFEEARDKGELDSATAALRPLLDYAFFAGLTATMETAEPERARQLLALRSALVESVDRADAAAQARVESAVKWLRELLAATDPEASIRATSDRLTPEFFFVLGENMRHAREQGLTDAASRLTTLHAIAVRTMESTLEPKERLLHRLARTTDESERVSLLSESRSVVDEEFVEMVAAAAREARSAGAGEVASNLEGAARMLASSLEPVPVGR